MRKIQKDMILELIATMCEAHNVVREYILKKDYDNAIFVLKDCSKSASNIYEHVKSLEKNEFEANDQLRIYCDEINTYINHLNNEEFNIKYLKRLDSLLFRFKSSIKQDIVPRLEIAFMPYKISMWDSMESVWKSACEDPNCDVYVVPIPYYDRNSDGSFGEYHYEGNEFPKDVHIIHYSAYDIEKHKPDIVYIHNPYDDLNYVTSVAAQYYSYNIKKNTEMLVYIPYGGVSGDENHFRGLMNSSAINYVDKIIVQSDYYRDLMIKDGISENKVLALGTPKSDKVYFTKKLDYYIPDSWGEILENKKIILLNTSIAACLNNSNWIDKIDKIIEDISKYKDISLIWRPHPLLDATINSMRPNYIQGYNNLKNKVIESENIIMDDTSDFYTAFALSDALVSDFSSAMFLYTITEKPILNIFDSVNNNRKIRLFDYYSNYFMDDGITIDKFIEMLLVGEDPNKNDRIKALYRSIKNIDGTCGKKVHRAITKEVLQQ